MTAYWGGWWVSYFYNDNTVRSGFFAFGTTIPTEQQIINVLVDPLIVYTGNLQSN